MEEIDWAQSITESNFLINENREWLNIKYEGSKRSAVWVKTALAFWPPTPGLGKARAKTKVLTPPEAQLYHKYPKASSSHLSKAPTIPVQRILLSVFRTSVVKTPPQVQQGIAVALMFRLVLSQGFLPASSLLKFHYVSSTREFFFFCSYLRRAHCCYLMRVAVRWYYACGHSSFQTSSSLRLQRPVLLLNGRAAWPKMRMRTLQQAVPHNSHCTCIFCSRDQFWQLRPVQTYRPGLVTSPD